MNAIFWENLLKIKINIYFQFNVFSTLKTKGSKLTNYRVQN
jgi:hypothetical protein